MRQCVVLLVIASLPGPAFGQEASSPARELRPIGLDQVLQARRYSPRGLPGLAWHPDGESFHWLARKDGAVVLQRQAAGDGKTTTVEIAPLLEALKKIGLAESVGGSLIGLAWREDGLGFRLVHAGSVYWIDDGLREARRVLELPPKTEAVAFAAGDRFAAYVENKDVHVQSTDGKTRRVTFDGSDDLTHGLSVSRVEFGITDGLWWCPKARRLAFYREDFTPIEAYPYLDLEKRPAALKEGRYPMAGRPGSVVSVGVYDTTRGTVCWLETDPELDQYLTNVTWHPSGDRLVVAHVTRGQDRMDLVEYDAATGRRLRLLLTERDEQWIEPEEGPLYLSDGSGGFLWFSYRSGHRHLELRAEDGSFVRQVTTGPFDVSAFRGWDPTGKGFFFETTGPDPRQLHLYHGALAVSQRAVTSDRGQHQVLIARDGRHVLDVMTSLEVPLVIDLVRVEDGKSLRRIYAAKDPLADFTRCRESLFTVKAETGEDLYGYLVRPPETTRGRKLPVIQYVYAGPHSQLVQDRWLCGGGRWNLWLHYMAQRGYVCFILDGRGTAHRGIEWAQSVHRQLGTLEIRDQVSGLEHVLSQDFADPDRVGVTGWSYGGFMTLCLMTREGRRYRAGVAGAPVTDWAFYETGYGERYMDTPEENPDGYAQADPGAHVKGIEGRLLVVHGSGDETVMWQSSLSFLRKCIDAGAPVDYMAYPGQRHGLRGKDFAHFIRKATDYLDLHVRDARIAPGR